MEKIERYKLMCSNKGIKLDKTYVKQKISEMQQILFESSDKNVRSHNELLRVISYERFFGRNDPIWQNYSKKQVNTKCSKAKQN